MREFPTERRSGMRPFPLLVPLAVAALTVPALAAEIPEEIPARRDAIDAFVRDQEAVGIAAYRAGDAAEAARVYERILATVDVALLPGRAPTIYYSLACFQSLAGRTEDAIESLEAAVVTGWSNADHLAKDPDLDPLRSDARFDTLLARARDAQALPERLHHSSAIETAYRETLPVEERIAGLSRLWSEATFAFAYFDQVPELDWNAEYLAYLPRVMATESTKGYYRLLSELVAKLRDGHTNVSFPRELREQVYARPELRTELIEDRVIVVEIRSDAVHDAGVSIGDEVLEVDGVAVKAYAAEHVAPYVAASTDQDRALRTYSYELLRGSVAEPVTLTLASADGTRQHVELPRTQYGGTLDRANVEWRRLDGDVGLVAIHTFNAADVDSLVREAMAELSDAGGLVIDIRQNGGGTSGWWVMRHLTDRCETTRWSARQYVAVHRAWGRGEGVVEGGPGVVAADDDDVRFDGPVALLVGPRTFSAAEDLAATFAHSGRGTIVGRPTGGSTGQPLFFSLPGGGGARVCAKRDVLPDGTPFVGIGVIPDVLVEPTVDDVRRGHDRALESARTLVISSG